MWAVVEVRTPEDWRLRTKASSDTGETGELSQHTAFCQSPASREVPMGFSLGFCWKSTLRAGREQRCCCPLTWLS